MGVCVYTYSKEGSSQRKGPGLQTFIARQPIFDNHIKVHAYELLFRSSLENVFRHANPDQAASKVIVDSSFLMGLETVTGHKKAFINVTRDVLINQYITLLPKELAVTELLETVKPDAEVIAACKALKKSGYILALDDFVPDEASQPLVDLADIIKVDFMSTGPEQQEALAKTLATQGKTLLAEKVESWKVFQEAARMGYTLFQGFFFSKPVILTGKDIPGLKLHYLNVLREINRPALDFNDLEDIIKREMSLCYKLLRYVNSPFFGLRSQIDSIKHALVLLGEAEVKKWASLIALASMLDDKPEELVVQAAVRAKFCESLAPLLGMAQRSQDLFLMGMLSLIDAILDRPLEEILKDIPIQTDVKDALLGKENQLSGVYELMLANEGGHWEGCSDRADRLALEPERLSDLYFSAIKWIQQNLPLPQAA